VQHFTSKHVTHNGRAVDALGDDVVASLQQYAWPGNVRELENTIERAVVLTTGRAIARDAITVEDGITAQPTGAPSLQLRQNIEWIERETIRRALRMSTRKVQAATLLGISPRALSYYLTKYPHIEQHMSELTGASPARAAL
jgi:transcriptional regulator with PAS, ATPase and Fis domain